MVSDMEMIMCMLDADNTKFEVKEEDASFLEDFHYWHFRDKLKGLAAIITIKHDELMQHFTDFYFNYNGDLLHMQDF